MFIFAYHIDGEDIQFFKTKFNNETEAMVSFLHHMDLHDDYSAFLEDNEDYDGTIVDWLYDYNDMNVGWTRV